MKAQIPAIALVGLIALVNSHLSAADKPTRPNVLFILADDWGDLSGHGNKLVNTPKLDRLAGEGKEFYQFNVCGPVCSPSRVAFMTGRFPARFSVHEAIGSPSKNHVAKENPDTVAKLSAKLAMWKESLPKEVPVQFVSNERRGKNRDQRAAPK